MKITRIRSEDVASIAPLFNAYRQFYEQQSDLEAATQFLTERLANEQSVLFAAVQDGLYVGFTQLYPTFSSVAMKRAYILNDLFVLPEARKQGVAQQLIEAAFSFATEQNARFVALETGAANVQAQQLYDKMGMHVEHDVLHYVRYFD